MANQLLKPISKIKKKKNNGHGSDADLDQVMPPPCALWLLHILRLRIVVWTTLQILILPWYSDEGKHGTFLASL